jgi:caa(3)-type oxidase subunit IV
MATTHHDAEHGHHVTPVGTLGATAGILVVLMLLTIGAARAPYEMPGMFGWMKEQWLLTNSIAIGIAVFKAYFVVSIFMGVKYTTRLVKLFAIGGFIWFFTIFIMFIDYWSRSWEPVRGWEDVPSSGLPRDRTQEAGVPYPVYEGKGGSKGH